MSGDLVRIEFALAADDDSWHYAGFAFTGGRFLGASAGCCPDGGDRNAAILNNAFHLAVEGGMNRGTGRAVAGAGPAHRGLVGLIFRRALTELLPPAVSFPLAADAIRQSAADLAPGTTVQRAVEQALAAVGLASRNASGGGRAAAHRARDREAARQGADEQGPTGPHAARAPPRRADSRHRRLPGPRLEPPARRPRRRLRARAGGRPRRGRPRRRPTPRPDPEQ